MVNISDIDLNAIDAVIFDLDGTLYNKRHLARRLVVGELGIIRLGVFYRERVARTELKGKYFGSREAFYEAFFQKMAEGNPLSVKAAQLWFEKEYMPLMIRTLRIMYAVEPWALDLANALHAAGKKVAVYSDYGCVEEKMKVLGVDLSLADVIVCAPDLGGLKPAKESMEKVVNMLGVPAERCLMLGDREDTDGESAKAVGAQFMLIKNE